MIMVSIPKYKLMMQSCYLHVCIPCKQEVITFCTQNCKNFHRNDDEGERRRRQFFDVSLNKSAAIPYCMCACSAVWLESENF